MADRYWVGGTGDWSDNTNHWSATSGGSGGATLPTSTDDVFINSSSGFGSGGTITLDAATNGLCNNFTSTSGHSYTITSDGDYEQFFVYGSAVFESGLTFTWADPIYVYPIFLATTSGKTVTMNGCSAISLSFYGIGGGWILQDDMDIVGYVDYSNGTFDANDHNITAGSFLFYADTDYTPTVIMGSGTWTAEGNDVDLQENTFSVFELNGQTVTIDCETSTIKLTDATFNKKTFSGGGKTYYNLWLTGAGSGEFHILGANTFNEFKCDTPSHTIKLEGNKTQTVTTWNVNGTDGNVITIDSAPTLSDSYSINNESSHSPVGTDFLQAVGQTFTGVAGELDTVEFYLGAFGGTPSGNCYAKIYAHTGTYGTTGLPTGAALAVSDAKDVVDFGDNGVFTFSGANRITLVTGTKYVVTFEWTGSGSGDEIYISDDDTSPTHSGNEVYYYGTWQYDPPDLFDTCFSVNIVGSQHTLSKSSGTVVSDYLDISNSNATGGATWYAGSHSLDTINNDGWMFIPTISPDTTNGHNFSSDTTPTLEFTGSDQDDNDLRYQLQIAEGSDFASPIVDKLSGTDPGFANTVTGGDTDPFNAGEKIGYTVQAGEALVVGTYYWRARCKDPGGSDTFSSWTSTRSFAVGEAPPANIWEAATKPFSSTLDGRFSKTDTSIVLRSASGLTAPGIVIIERLDLLGFRSMNMEVCSFTEVVGNTLHGLTRGLAGTVARDHNSGMVAEALLSINHWQSLRDALVIEHNEDTGRVKWDTHIQNMTATGVSGASGLRGDVILHPEGNFVIEAVSGASAVPAISLNLGPYSGSIPVMQLEGGIKVGANQTPLLIIEDPHSLKSVSALLRYPASGASLVLDVNNNGTSVFSPGYELSIPGGGTYASTASLANTSLLPGNFMSLDIDAVSWGGDLTVLLET